MKMRWFDRVFQLVSGLVLLALGVLLLLFGAGVLRFDAFAMDTFFAEPWQWTPIFMAASVLLIALGFRLVYVSFGTKKGKYYAVKSGDSDHVQISIQAIDHLTRKCLRHYNEIFLSHVNIEGQHGGIVIHLRMTVRSDVRIPELVSEIRQNVKEYIEECSGVKVERVEVMVEATKDVDQPETPESPEALPAPEPMPLLPFAPETDVMPLETAAQLDTSASSEASAPAQNWQPEEEASPEISDAANIIVRDENVVSNEARESMPEDMRDPIFFSVEKPEEPFLQETEQPVAENETNAPLFESGDELVSLDALEPEIEDHDAENDDWAWEDT